MGNSKDSGLNAGGGGGGGGLGQSLAGGSGLGLGLSSSTSTSIGGGLTTVGTPSSVYPSDTIRDVAESLGIVGLKENVAIALAADVEYRIREIVQEAAKYMRHSKRDQLKTTDVDAALRAKNIEPLYGFLPSGSGRSSGSSSKDLTAGPSFRRVQTASGVPLHYVEDEEIDFEKILEAGPRIGVGRGVGWGAHWLAIEGVQPAIPQNPSPASLTSQPAGRRVTFSSSVENTSTTKAVSVTVAGGGETSQAVAKPLIKHILSRELQLYYERLTKAIISPPPEADDDLEDEDGGEEDGGGVKKDGREDLEGGDVEMKPLASSPGGEPSTPPRPGASKLVPMKSFASKGSGNHVRDAALSSLRGDAGLHQLVPYLIQWVGSKIVEILRGGRRDSAEEEGSGGGQAEGPSGGGEEEGEEVPNLTRADNHMLGVMLSTIHAILVNPHIYIEPYLHQIMPSILSILLTSSLSPDPGGRRRPDQHEGYYNPLITAGPSSYSLRAHSSALLAHVVEKYSKSYPTLKPRVVATLLKAVLAGAGGGGDSSSSTTGPKVDIGTKLGALMGLRRLGRSSFGVMLEPNAKLGGGGDDLEEGGERRRWRKTPLGMLGDWLEEYEKGNGMVERKRDDVESRKEEVKAILMEITGAIHSFLPPFLPPEQIETRREEEEERKIRERLLESSGDYLLRNLVEKDPRVRKVLEMKSIEEGEEKTVR
ncbi:hypothetical protein IE53DRAFT_385279 [Violaceomyces palustris]|uniref:Uncharacterized protein n=1 Tax=Violaceomyces palustris TaxID=1673888 RepID=A0ACD0P2P4_9BASI|nr:hypothetical protein IE53DRAFT_385279 [Violaceomyces palustris]